MSVSLVGNNNECVCEIVVANDAEIGLGVYAQPASEDAWKLVAKAVKDGIERALHLPIWEELNVVVTFRATASALWFYHRVMNLLQDLAGDVVAYFGDSETYTVGDPIRTIKCVTKAQTGVKIMLIGLSVYANVPEPSQERNADAVDEEDSE